MLPPWSFAVSETASDQINHVPGRRLLPPSPKAPPERTVARSEATASVQVLHEAHQRRFLVPGTRNLGAAGSGPGTDTFSGMFSAGLMKIFDPSSSSSLLYIQQRCVLIGQSDKRSSVRLFSSTFTG